MKLFNSFLVVSLWILCLMFMSCNKDQYKGRHAKGHVARMVKQDRQNFNLDQAKGIVNNNVKKAGKREREKKKEVKRTEEDLKELNKKQNLVKDEVDVFDFYAF